MAVSEETLWAIRGHYIYIGVVSQLTGEMRAETRYGRPTSDYWGTIKIGFSVHPPQQIRQYGLHPILAIFPGLPRTETSIHRRFHHRLVCPKEWFEDCDEIREYAARKGIHYFPCPSLISVEDMWIKERVPGVGIRKRWVSPQMTEAPPEGDASVSGETPPAAKQDEGGSWAA